MKQAVVLLVVCACALALPAPGWGQAAPAAASDKLQMVIWGGGAAPADAQKALAVYDSYKDVWRDALVFPPGYPKIIESAGVEGLKPGFHIVVLGVCTEKEAGKLMRGMRVPEPGVYSRAVAWKEGPACPKTGPSWIWPFAAEARSKNATLSSMYIQNFNQMNRVLVLARDKSGAITDKRVDVEICRDGALIYPDQEKLLFEGTCTVAVDPVPVEAEILFEYRIAPGGKVERKTLKEKRLKPGS